MDFQRSFSYVFEDPSWLQKIVIGSLISIIPVANFAAVGFAIETMGRAKEGVVPVLPEWKRFGYFFKEGFTFLLGLLAYQVIPVIPAFTLGLTSVFSSSIEKLITEPIFSGFAWILIILTFLYILALIFFYPAIYLNFGKKRTASAIFELREIVQIFFSSPERYILCWLNIALAFLLVVIAAAIPGIGLIISVLISFYVNLVVSGAIAQLWISIDELLDKNVLKH